MRCALVILLSDCGEFLRRTFFRRGACSFCFFGEGGFGDGEFELLITIVGLLCARCFFKNGIGDSDCELLIFFTTTLVPRRTMGVPPLDDEDLDFDFGEGDLDLDFGEGEAESACCACLARRTPGLWVGACSARISASRA